MNKSLLLTGAMAFGLALPSLAQQPVQVKYANTITAEDLKERLTYLASDEMKGRDTGSEEQKVAAKYLADFYKKIGLTAPVDGSYLQPVDLVSASFGEISLKVGNNKLVNNTDFVFTGDGNMKKAAKTELVFLGLVTDENLAKVDVKDKLVGIWAVGVRSNDLVMKVMEAGAAGIVIVSMEGQANFDRIAGRYQSLAGKGRVGFDKPVEQRPIFMVSSDKMAELFNTPVEELKEAAKTNPQSIKA
ncbi:MAG: peptidase M28, partial [Algoriphagus sp.]